MLPHETPHYSGGNFDLEVNLSYLGDSLRLGKHKDDDWTLDEIYTNMATLNSIGMVASDKGGWENAINELLRAGIPLYVNPELNSCYTLTEKMGIRILARSLIPCYKLTDKYKVEDLKNLNATTDTVEIRDFVSWVNDYHESKSKERQELIEYNYKQAYEYLSIDAKKKDFVELLNKL